MYTLHLTHGDRRAIDFVGDRYRHGHDLFKVLMDCIDYQDEPDAFGDSWSDPIDWILKVPEHLAWEIRAIIEDSTNLYNKGLDLFNPKLTNKFIDFTDEIV